MKIKTFHNKDTDGAWLVHSQKGHQKCFYTGCSFIAFIASFLKWVESFWCLFLTCSSFFHSKVLQTRPSGSCFFFVTSGFYFQNKHECVFTFPTVFFRWARHFSKVYYSLKYLNYLAKPIGLTLFNECCHAVNPQRIYI